MYFSSTSTDNHDIEYQPTSSKLHRQSEPTLLSPQNITLPLASIGGSHSTCFACKKRGPKLIVASTSVRLNCFLYNNIIVPAGSRCCPGHVNDDAFTDQAINMMTNCRPNTDFNRTEIANMFNKVRETLLSNKERRISFDSKLGDADFKNLTGLDKVSFDDLLTYLTSVRDTQVRSARMCLGIFLTKMKTGISNKVLSTLFSVSKDSIRLAISSKKSYSNIHST